MAFLNVSVKDTKGSLNRLPFPTDANQPVFCWELPAGIVQKAFCLELKSRFPTVLSDGTRGFAYYNSSVVESDTPEHQISFAMFQSVWRGIIEVRIRIYGPNGSVAYCTHEQSETAYPFETIPQGYAWDSAYDGCYYLLDNMVEHITGTVSPVFEWRNAEDEDEGQTISYQLQWSLTPLFLDGILGQQGASNTKTAETAGKAGLHSALTTIVDRKDPLFYRVRAYDGLDYGEWSMVNGFYSTPSSAPYCVFNWVNTNCTSADPNVILRPNGEVEISFRVIDLDTPQVSAYLTFKLDDVEYPCSLSASTVSVPSNEDVTVKWYSARQLPNRNVIVYLYLYAFDGTSESYKIVWSQPLTVNNSGIGFGYNDSTDDVMSYRFAGWLRNYERWIHVPVEKAVSSVENGQVVYQMDLTPQYGEWGDRMDWPNFWTYYRGLDISQYLISAGEQIALPHRARIKRPNWNIYDGYDDEGRLEADKLYLEYEDEFHARKRDDNEYFEVYYGGSWGYNLGRGIPDITYFLTPPLYGSSIRMKRPQLVRAGNTGLFIDGAGLNNNVSDYFGAKESADIQALINQPLWKNFYQFDPMYQPTVKGVYTILGPVDYRRWDYENRWYWTLFEYAIHLIFPFGVERGVNDRFAYRFNGEVFQGSILEDGENTAYFTYTSRIPDKLRQMFERLFPASIFQTLPEVDYSNGEYRFTMHSTWTDANRTFQFVETENSCYRTLSIDRNIRFSKREKCDYGTRDNYVVYTPYQNSGIIEPAYEVAMDSSHCIGTKGEINTSEPLFTCDPHHLNQHGCHYKYTKERFLASGKVYVRKYFVRPVYMTESSEPLRDPLFADEKVPAVGFRNYRLKHVGENSLGEPLFVKEELPGRFGGLPARSKTITVIAETEYIEEPGWWLPTGNLDKPGDCISHTWNESKQVYYRLKPRSYAQRIGFRDCYCTEYVELSEAWEKPFYDHDLPVSRIDRRQPVAHRSEIPQGYIQYILGAYKPPKSQSVEISPYDYDFTSVVEAEENYDRGRYEAYWDDKDSERFSEKQGIVVDPLLIEPGGIERSIEKWGYVPDLSLQNYFKEDTENIWQGRIIPRNNSYVHGIYKENDISFPYTSRIHMYRRLISDTSKVNLPPDEGTKAPYLDYRVHGGSPWTYKYYYSALPQDESPAYAARPPEIYGEDRPLRISGFIDAMSVVVPWKMLYLQTEWNSYNLLHWEGSQDENVYAKLEVAPIDENGVTGSFLTMRTRQAEWFSKYSCWLIPFAKLRQSDYIDTLNGTFSSVQNGFRTDHNFEDGKQYRFRVSGLNINSGSANTPTLSPVFTYSREAYSPPIITKIDYDKWKKEFSIEFRFDDIRGRKYDIINVLYATYEPDQSSPPDSAFIPLGTEVLEGQLTDLESNITGDNVISEAHLVKHKLFVASDLLDNVAGRNIRFRLEGIASEDREGMTSPVFNFLMWGNEFLKKADTQIAATAGTRNRWVYNTSINDEGEAVEQWLYLSEEDAVVVPGTISEQNAVIESINQNFEEWYRTVAKFEQPSFDAGYNCLCIRNGEDEFYSTLFNAFIAASHLETEWTQYQLDHPTRNAASLEPLFIAQKGWTEDFAFFWDNRAAAFLGELEGFAAWFEDNRIITREESKPFFLAQEEHAEDYRKYLEENSLADDDDSRTSFIVAGSLQTAFEQYYILLNNYPDGRFDDRRQFVESNWSQEYIVWKSAPVDAYGTPVDPGLILYEDDALRLFIAHDREIWRTMSYANTGKRDAQSYYLTVTENGVSYGQQIQTASSRIAIAQSTLNSAYAVRNHYESLHRRRLISKGYFSNGWKNNQVYTGDSKNEVFRFRVENQPVTGKRAASAEEVAFDGSWPEMVAPVAGYDTRWDIYFHFQMDFYDSFDSQNGKPLRDYLYQRLDCSGYAGSDADSKEIDGKAYVRIMGGIEAENGNMHVLPENVYTPEGGQYGKAPTSSDPYSFQFAGRFSIPKSELPGELENDRLPEYWNAGQPSDSDDFNQAYYWRVCPYNLVKRPVFEREGARVDSLEFFANYDDYEPYKYWKAVIWNNFYGKPKYSKWSGEDYGYYWYIWVSYRKANPVWKRDVESACWNPREGYYENFFPGTDSDRMDTAHTENPCRPSYRSRILRGEVVFLTDRPREMVDGSLQYIEDTNGHFRSLWIPFNTERAKPWMFFDRDECCWFIISQKPNRNRNGYQEYVFTLSRGLSPQTFGEECQLFPASSMDTPDSVLEGALSFENPCVVKRDGLYEIYFNVLKEGGVYELFRAESKDLYSWNNFIRLEIDEDGYFSDLSVYREAEQYVLYAVQGTGIRKFVSEDGIRFRYDRNIYADMYMLTRPTLLDGRIYFGMEFSGKGKIISIDESGEYSSLRVEKGSSSDFENAVTFNSEDVYFSPVVFEDFDKGTRVRRVIYEKSASVHAYEGNTLKELAVQEKAFFTEYCEEYEWERTYINDYYGSEIYVNGEYYPVLKDENGNRVNLGYDAYIPTGRLELVFLTNREPLQLKVPFYLDSVFEDTESEGEWLDFYNVSDTSAVLSPEIAPEDYDVGDYGTGVFISSNNLTAAYDEWLRENYPSPEEGREESYRIEFLLSCRQYSVYLKWSRKGPGIYRHLNAVKRTSYTGDGSNV